MKHDRQLWLEIGQKDKLFDRVIKAWDYLVKKEVEKLLVLLPLNFADELEEDLRQEGTLALCEQVNSCVELVQKGHSGQFNLISLVQSRIHTRLIRFLTEWWQIERIYQVERLLAFWEKSESHYLETGQILSDQEIVATFGLVEAMEAEYEIERTEEERRRRWYPHPRRQRGLPATPPTWETFALEQDYARVALLIVPCEKIRYEDNMPSSRGVEAGSVVMSLDPAHPFFLGEYLDDLFTRSYLTENEKKVFIGFILEGHLQYEVAEQIGVTTETVGKILKRLILKLKRRR